MLPTGLLPLVPLFLHLRFSTSSFFLMDAEPAFPLTGDRPESTLPFGCSALTSWLSPSVTPAILDPPFFPLTSFRRWRRFLPRRPNSFEITGPRLARPPDSKVICFPYLWSVFPSTSFVSFSFMGGIKDVSCNQTRSLSSLRNFRTPDSSTLWFFKWYPSMSGHLRIAFWQLDPVSPY